MSNAADLEQLLPKYLDVAYASITGSYISAQQSLSAITILQALKCW